MIIDIPYTRICWHAEGVRLVTRSYLYLEATTLPPDSWGKKVDGELPRVFYVVVDWDNPLGRVDCKYQDPTALQAINEWVGRERLLQQWEQETTYYNETVGGIHLPGIVPDSDYLAVDVGLDYNLLIESQGTYCLPPIDVRVRVLRLAGQAEVRVGIPIVNGDGNEDVWPICSYTAKFPITTDSLRAGIKPVFQQYLAACE